MTTYGAAAWIQRHRRMIYGSWTEAETVGLYDETRRAVYAALGETPPAETYSSLPALADYEEPTLQAAWLRPMRVPDDGYAYECSACKQLFDTVGEGCLRCDAALCPDCARLHGCEATEDATLADIAPAFDCIRQRVWQIEQVALEKLRKLVHRLPDGHVWFNGDRASEVESARVSFQKREAEQRERLAKQVAEATASRQTRLAKQAAEAPANLAAHRAHAAETKPFTIHLGHEEILWVTHDGRIALYGKWLDEQNRSLGKAVWRWGTTYLWETTVPGKAVCFAHRSLVDGTVGAVFLQLHRGGQMFVAQHDAPERCDRVPLYAYEVLRALWDWLYRQRQDMERVIASAS